MASVRVGWGVMPVFEGRLWMGAVLSLRNEVCGRIKGEEGLYLRRNVPLASKGVRKM
jgi:hypothetical protein